MMQLRGVLSKEVLREPRATARGLGKRGTRGPGMGCTGAAGRRKKLLFKRARGWLALLRPTEAPVRSPASAPERLVGCSIRLVTSSIHGRGTLSSEPSERDRAGG